jgi:hypothetical protein
MSDRREATSSDDVDSIPFQAASDDARGRYRAAITITSQLVIAGDIMG